MAPPAYRPVSDAADGHGKSDDHGSTIELLSLVATARPALTPSNSVHSQPQSENAVKEPHPEDKGDHNIRGWPRAPTRLTKPQWGAIIRDLLTLVVPFPFLALAIAVLRVDGEGVDAKSWRQYQNATRVAATVFPIAFAAVVGGMVTKLAAWKLERGSKVRSLEQLIGSRTVFSTVTTQVGLRSLNVLGSALALLWALSPLGGQSALRVIDTGFKTLQSNSSVLYFDTGAQSDFAEWFDGSTGGADAVSTALALLNSMYTASLLSSSEVKASAMDLWGNVKIPYLSSYQSQPASEWTDVPPWPRVQYSSLIGVPVFGIQNGNSSFPAEPSYIEVQCSNISTQPNVIELDSTYLDDVEECPTADFCSPIPNGTYQGLGLKSTSTTWTLGLDTFVNPYWYNATILEARGLQAEQGWAHPGLFINETDISSSPGTLLFQSYNVQPQMYTGPQINYTRAYCKVAEVYVQSRINCSLSLTSAQNCSVVAQRPSLRRHAPEAITPFSWPQVFRYVSEQQPLANGQKGLDGTSDLALYYVHDTSTAYMTNTGQFAILDDIPETVFSQRLGQILNTYLLLSQAYTSVTGVAGQNFMRNISTQVTVSQSKEIYIISKPWIALFIFATLALLGAALVSVVFGHMTTSPELLGYASSVLRDSRHVDLPPGGGTLSGIEMARCLKDMEVRYGIVGREPDGIGTLGVSVKERVGRVSKTALYM